MPIEELFIRKVEEAISDRVVRAWLLAEWRRELEIVNKLGLRPSTKRKILADLDEKVSSLKRQIEILRLEGRKAWEEYKRTGNIEKLHEARVCWGRAGYYSRYIRSVLLYLSDFWTTELAEEEKKEYIGIDADTGFKIFYDVERNKYIEVDPFGRITYESNELEVDESLSLETPEGHDAPLVCEATTTFKIKGITKKILEDIAKGLQTRLEYFIKEPSVGFERFKGYFRFKNPTRKVGLEFRIRARKETPYFPKSFSVIERVSSNYPTPRPYPWIGAFLVDWSKERGEEIEKHVVGVKVKKKEKYEI